MKKILLTIILICSSLSVLKAQVDKLVIADFNRQGNTTKLGEDFGSWDKDASDLSQSCKISHNKDDALIVEDGGSLQIDYDVDSPNPAFNGFWLKISSAKVAEFNTLSFYVKGVADKGFTSKIKIELKDKKKGKATFLIENITSEWQKISLTLDNRFFSEKQPEPFEEFVVVFDDVTSNPRTGRILLDQIEFSKD